MGVKLVKVKVAKGNRGFGDSQLLIVCTWILLMGYNTEYNVCGICIIFCIKYIFFYDGIKGDCEDERSDRKFIPDTWRFAPYIQDLPDPAE